LPVAASGTSADLERRTLYCSAALILDGAPVIRFRRVPAVFHLTFKAKVPVWSGFLRKFMLIPFKVPRKESTYTGTGEVVYGVLIYNFKELEAQPNSVTRRLGL